MPTSDSKNQVDPVCGCSVDPKKSSCKADYKHEKYSFCCNECMNSFKKNPEKYAKKK